MVAKNPKVNSEGQKELDKAQEQFDAFDKEVKQMTLDRMNEAPKEDSEPVHKISQKDMEKVGEIYLKPNRSIGSKEKFNEDYRKEYEYAKEYVKFIAENKEIIGEMIELWTKPFAGLPAEEWKVPVGTPVWGPRYLAERIASCRYHRLIMKDDISGSDSRGVKYYGQMAVDTTLQRLNATPAQTKKSIFFSESDFKFDGRKAA